MRATSLMLLTCGLIAVSSPSWGQAFVPAPNATHKVDLDTTAGTFSIWSADDLLGVSAVRATFAVRRMGTDKRWAPAFRFALKNADESLSFRLIGTKPKEPILVRMTYWKGGKPVSEGAFLTTMMMDEVADLDIDWDPSGVVVFRLRSPQALTINAKGEAHRARMESPPTSLEISASTGELEVKSLRLGATKP